MLCHVRCNKGMVFMQLIEKLWRKILLSISTFWNIFRYGHFFSNIGKNTYFEGVLDFSPDYKDTLLVSVGSDSIFYSNISIRGRGKLVIGDCCSVNSGVIFGLTNDLIIGNHVLIADNVSFRTADHEFSDISTPISLQGERSAPIKIGNDVWIGANVVILRGVIIGDGVIISANSVVNCNVKPYEVVRGVPIEVIKRRK